MVKYKKKKKKKKNNYKNKMKGKCLLLLYFVGPCVLGVTFCTPQNK